MIEDESQVLERIRDHPGVGSTMTFEPGSHDFKRLTLILVVSFLGVPLRVVGLRAAGRRVVFRFSSDLVRKPLP